MKDSSRRHRIGLVLEAALFSIALFILLVDKDAGKVALIVWGCLLVGIPFCISHCADKDEMNERPAQDQNIATS